MSDKFRTFAMSYFCSFPPKVTFPGCSEEFLFPVAKIRNIYHIDNQFVIILSLFRDCPYLIAIFVMSVAGSFIFLSNTKISEFCDMTKS